jgi:hypothetical protein
MVLTKKEAIDRLSNKNNFTVSVLADTPYGSKIICPITSGILVKANIQHDENLIVGSVVQVPTGIVLIPNTGNIRDLETLSLVMDYTKADVIRNCGIKSRAAHLSNTGEIIVTVEFVGEFAATLKYGTSLGRCLVTDTVRYIPEMNVG